MNDTNNSVSTIENTNECIILPVNINKKPSIENNQSEELVTHVQVGKKKNSLLIIIPMAFHSLGIIFGDM